MYFHIKITLPIYVKYERNELKIKINISNQSNESSTITIKSIIK